MNQLWLYVRFPMMVLEEKEETYRHMLQYVDTDTLHYDII